MRRIFLANIYSHLHENEKKWYQVIKKESMRKHEEEVEEYKEDEKCWNKIRMRNFV